MPAQPWGVLAKELRAFVHDTLEIPYDLLQITFIFNGVQPVTLHMPPASWQGTLPTPPAPQPPTFPLPHLPHEPENQPDSPTGTTEVEDAILDALEGVRAPIKGPALARRAQRCYNSHFRKVLRGLVAKGLVKKLARKLGFWPADRPEPPQPELTSDC